MFPSTVVTVIVAVPAATPVTIPFDTVTTPSLSVLHVKALFDALLGPTVAVNVTVSPIFTLDVLVFKLTPVTGTFGFTSPAPISFHSPKPSVSEKLAS